MRYSITLIVRTQSSLMQPVNGAQHPTLVNVTALKMSFPSPALSRHWSRIVFIKWGFIREKIKF